MAFFKQAKPYGLFDKMKWVISTGADVSLARAMGKEMPTGIIADQRYYFHWPNSGKNQDFVKAYLEKNKEYPSAWSAQGYGGVYFLAEAVRKANSLDKEKVVAALEGLTIDAPRRKATLRKEDHQLFADYMVGETGWDKSYPVTIVTNTEVLLLDEPSEGLAPLVVALLAEMILQIRKEGVTVLLAEQNLHFCAKVSDRGYVIDKGSVRYEGAMKDLLADEEVKEKYLAV